MTRKNKNKYYNIIKVNQNMATLQVHNFSIDYKQTKINSLNLTRMHKNLEIK